MVFFMASELYNTIDALSREKGIDPQIVVSAVEDARSLSVALADPDRVKGYSYGAVDYLLVPVVQNYFGPRCGYLPTCSGSPGSLNFLMRSWSAAWRRGPPS